VLHDGLAPRAKIVTPCLKFPPPSFVALPVSRALVLCVNGFPRALSCVAYQGCVAVLRKLDLPSPERPAERSRGQSDSCRNQRDRDRLVFLVQEYYLLDGNGDRSYFIILRRRSCRATDEDVPQDPECEERRG
jgi:hypothetical protein